MKVCPTVTVLYWKDEGKPRKTSDNGPTIGLRAEIRMSHLPNMTKVW